mmetsp:Transcript_41712/g.58196  ORF Transcript_41712/g.58196 Transcript_41712/m.58196 type:complete len:611 (+) Transcript_41712:21-1853(+)
MSEEEKDSSHQKRTPETRICLLYGSQTRCAQEVAEFVEDEARNRSFQTHLSALDDYDVRRLPHETLVVFIVSTCGQGEMPDNMKKFWKFLLRKNLPNTSLCHCSTAVFGLGDSSYSKFNFAAKKLFRRLETLGASMLLERGDGDDQHPLGLDGALDPWLNKLWDVLATKFQVPSTLPPNRGLLTRNQIHVSKEKPVSMTVDQSPSPLQSGKYSMSSPFYAKLQSCDRITDPEWEQDVRHCVFNLGSSGISYSPGDVVSILPSNSEEVALSFLKHAKLDPALVITSIVPNDPGDTRWQHVSLPITLGELATRYLDIQGHPRRLFFRQISFLTQSDVEQEKLAHFASADGQGDLRLYNQKEGRTYFEVLEDFRNVSFTLDELFTIIPPIRPRRFSISSALSAFPNEIQVTLAVIQYKTPLGRPRRGLCSGWLADLPPGSLVPIFVEQGAIHLPSPQTSVISVGPGTGCAAFRSFIQERDQQKQKSQDPKGFGQFFFFFGCRHQSKDHLYANEMLQYVGRESLDLYSVAFSRDQPQKIYVQDKILQFKDEVWSLLQDPKSRVFVSGSSLKMPQDVRNAFRDVCVLCGKMSQDEADALLRKMEATGRYTTETWS